MENYCKFWYAYCIVWYDRKRKSNSYVESLDNTQCFEERIHNDSKITKAIVTHNIMYVYMGRTHETSLNWQMQ